MPGFCGEVGVQELDRHVEVEVAVAAPVDDAHAPLADPREELAPANVGQSQVRIVGHAGTPNVLQSPPNYAARPAVN